MAILAVLVLQILAVQVLGIQAVMAAWETQAMVPPGVGGLQPELSGCSSTTYRSQKVVKNVKYDWPWLREESFRVLENLKLCGVCLWVVFCELIHAFL